MLACTCPGILYRPLHQTPHLLTARSDVLIAYKSLVAVNELQYDTQQVKVVKELQKLQKTLDGYRPHVPGLMDKVNKINSRVYVLGLMELLHYIISMYKLPSCFTNYFEIHIRANLHVEVCFYSLQIFGSKKNQSKKTKGLYMHGSVGKC